MYKIKPAPLLMIHRKTDIIIVLTDDFTVYKLHTCNIHLNIAGKQEQQLQTKSDFVISCDWIVVSLDAT